MIHIGLFEGIGGFSIAAHEAGWQTVATCEIADFPRSVLKHHLPKAYHHQDIHTLTYDTINTELSARFGQNWRHRDVVLTGGWPCQPFSDMGKRKGDQDERHLWPEMLRTIREIRPAWVVGENVLGLVNWSAGMVFEQVCSDLEAEGYQVQAYVIPAAGCGAPHTRERVWVVAYNAANANRNGLEGGVPTDIDRQQPCSQGDSQERVSLYRNEIPFEGFPTQSPVCAGNDGLSEELDNRTLLEGKKRRGEHHAYNHWRRESVKAYGNAIAPPVALQIFKTINDFNQQTK